MHHGSSVIISLLDWTGSLLEVFKDIGSCLRPAGTRLHDNEVEPLDRQVHLLAEDMQLRVRWW